MDKISIKGQVFDIDLVAFDKDGCLFDSVSFWLSYAQARYEQLVVGGISEEVARHWLAVEGAYGEEDENGTFKVNKIDPVGALAVASPDEEVFICATVLMEQCKMRWTKAREFVTKAFAQADKNMKLEECAIPKKGFPDVFHRLTAAGIPFGVATSDNSDRAYRAIAKYTDASALSFIYTGDDVKRNKPNPDLLLLISKKFNVPTSRILMVGDNYVDVAMAKNAGSIGMGIPEFENTKKRMEKYATVIAESLDDLVIL